MVTVGLILVGAVITGFAVWSVMSPAPPRLARFAISEPPNVFINPGSSTPGVTISPDGTRIVYVGPESQLYVRAVDQLNSVALRGGVGRNPFISPDGNWVGFRGSDDALKKVSIHGGPPVVLSEGMDGIAGASWGVDDSIIFGTVRANVLFRVSAAGGEEREPLTDLEEGELSHRWPEILPGGRTVLFTVEKGQGDANREIAALNLETGERKLLIPGGSNPHYAATGHIVYGVDGTLRGVPFDLDAVEVKGDTIPVLEGVVTQSRGDAQFSLAEDGTLVYVPGAAVTGGSREIFWIDRDGQVEPLGTPARNYISVVLSPDGRQALLEIEGGGDVWVTELARGTLTRITTDPGDDGSPLWSPDGRRVVFTSNRSGRLELLWKAADGTGTAETLASFDEAEHRVRPYSWSPEGSALVIEINNPDTGQDVGLVSVDGTGEWEPLIQTAADEQEPVISPDGRWIAYTSDETGEGQVYVQRFPDLGDRRQISVGGGRRPTWSRDGSALIYLGGGPPPTAVMRVTVQDDAAAVGPVVGTAGTPLRLSLLFPGRGVQVLRRLVGW